MNITVMHSFVTIFVHVLMCAADVWVQISAADLEGLLVQREPERGHCSAGVCPVRHNDYMNS